MNYSKIALPVVALAMMASCTDSFTENQAKLPDGLSASISDPESGDEPSTKALASDFTFSFVEDEQINVFSLKENSNAAMIYALLPDAANVKSASFKPNSYTLEDGDFAALYPSQTFQLASLPAVSLSFSGQAQASDASSAHLAAYDYCWAKAAVANNAGNFSFNHKVTWLKVSLLTTDAANIKAITVSADEGVANTGTIDISTGVLTPSRSATDVITLSLGGDSGIDVAANDTLTAFITLAPGKYTNLNLSATDAAGKTYKFHRTSEISFVEGKYYNITVKRTDIPENTPFTALTAFGSYSKTNTTAPTGVKLYDDDNDQMSYGTGSSYRTFKLADMATNSYAIFEIASGTLTVGETYTVSSDINGTKSETSCKVVKMTDDCVWLEDKTNNIGFIFAIE